jgi:Kdo2-lipid IVA lauroyltransferase/acyltransferase
MRRVLLALGAFLAALAFALGVRRRVVLANLALAFPEKTEAERRAIARATYRTFGRVAAEFLLVPRLSPGELRALFVHEGWEHVEAARSSGRGLIACTAHFGNFEVLAAAHTMAGVPITMISRAMGRSRFNDLWRRTRARAGVEDLVVGKGDVVRAAVRSLKSGRVLGYVIDQNEPSAHAVFPTFFGVPAATSPTPAVLARRTGADVIFTVDVPLADGRHRVIIEKVELPDTGDRGRDAQLFMQLLNDRLEHWVRRHPECWFWFHRRWKRSGDAPAAAAPASAPPGGGSRVAGAPAD